MKYEYLETVPNFLRNSTEGNPFLAHAAQMSFGDGNRYLFSQLQQIPRGDIHQFEEVRAAIVVNNLGLLLVTGKKAWRNVIRFYENHGQTVEVGKEDIFSCLLYGLAHAMTGYNPDTSEFSTYATLALKRSVYRYMLQPFHIGDSASETIKHYIFSRYSMARRAVLPENEDQLSSEEFEERVILWLHNEYSQHIAEPISFETFHAQYTALLQIPESLEQRKMRRSSQEVAMGLVEEGEVLGSGYSGIIRGHVLEEDGDSGADPQEREKMLLDEFDPDNPDWQQSLGDVFSDMTGPFTDFFADHLTEQEATALLASFVPIAKKGSHYGKLPTNEEIGVSMVISPQRVQQLMTSVREKLIEYFEINGQIHEDTE